MSSFLTTKFSLKIIHFSCISWKQVLTQTISALIWKGYYIPLNMNGMARADKRDNAAFFSPHRLHCIQWTIDWIESMPTQIIKHTNKIINIEIISFLFGFGHNVIKCIVAASHN